MNDDRARQDEAAGALAESRLPNDTNLLANKEKWLEVIMQVRKDDAANGTNNAAAITGVSPHFRRGLVQARAERLGRGLQQHLSSVWNDNADGIQDVDDPEQVQSWVAKVAQEYAQDVGINGIDPIIARDAYLPYVAQSQDRLIGHHAKHRAEQRAAAYEAELYSSVGWLTNGGGTGDSTVNDFLRRLTGSESSGNKKAFRTNKDGRSFGGLVQMGKARLDQWAAATGNKKITVQQYKQLSAEEQLRIADWHIRDIDRVIDENGYISQGWSRDGLRSVAHLGGIGGMKQFVKTNGGYNPADELGTHLSTYYKRFSSSASAIQKEVDTAVANGMDPKRANEIAVQGVLSQAVATKNPKVLDQLMEIDTGFGVLGNVGWVRDLVNETREAIEDDLWEDEDRNRKVEKWERDAVAQDLKIEGYARVMDDPRADHSEFIGTIRDAGFPDLANAISTMQQNLQDRSYKIRTNDQAVLQLRRMIEEGEASPSELMDFIAWGVNNGDFSSSVAVSLMDDLRTAKEKPPAATDSLVQRAIKESAAIVEQRYIGSDGFFSVTSAQRARGAEKALEFENELQDDLTVYLEDNPNASPARLRQFMRQKASELLKLDRYNQVAEPEATSTALDGDTPAPAAAAPESNPADILPSLGISRERAELGRTQYNETYGTNLSLDEFIRLLEDGRNRLSEESQ
jgi:hypothetical protein